MQYNNYFNALLKRFGITPNASLTVALTHNSYHDTKNNSKYVFIAMYALKGQIAEYIYKNIGGTGTQLQHFYGNCTSNKYLQILFDKLELNHHIRIAPKVRLENQKHIMVLGLLGYIYSKLFIADIHTLVTIYFIQPNEGAMPTTYLPKNQWAQLKLITKQQYNSWPILHAEVINQVHQLKIVLQDKVIAEASSISHRYAKKKAITMALKNIATQSDTQIKTTENFINKKNQLADEKKKKKEQEKEAASVAYKAKLAVKLAAKAEAKLIAKNKAIEEDKKRRKLKQFADVKKNRKGKDTIYKTYTAEEIAAMSNSKRRNLQDKGIIPKGI